MLIIIIINDDNYNSGKDLYNGNTVTNTINMLGFELVFMISTDIATNRSLSVMTSKCCAKVYFLLDIN